VTLPGIDRMAVAMPALTPVASLVEEAGMGCEAIRVLHGNGLSAVPVAEPGDFLQFALSSVKLLLAERPGVESSIRFVLLAHSSPLLCPGHVGLLAGLVAGTGVPDAASFAITGQPCAILHTAVRCGLDLLQDYPDRESSILVVGVDRANHAAERLFFGSAMGDASVALLLGRRTERRRVVGSFQHTELHASEGEWSAPEQIQAFRERNPLLVRSAVEGCLAQAGHSLSDVQAIIPHTPYLSIWDVMAGLLRFPRERILTDYIGETGHLSSNDSFVHFCRAEQEGRVQPGDLVLLVNPGFGGSRGCTLIRA
jgi:3-oxoacyl-[acyl-carrier-protein] synthase-3